MDDQLQSSSLCFINTRQLGNESYVVISLNCRMDWGYIRAIVYIFCFWFICLLVFVFMEYFKLFTRNNKVSRLLVNLNRLSMMYFMFPCDQFSIIIDGSKVYTFSLYYWKWSNASCNLMNIKYDQYKSVITFKSLSLPFLHFICFKTSRLLPFYKRSSTSIPARSKWYISTTSFLRNIQKDAIIMLCTECVLSSLI